MNKQTEQRMGEVLIGQFEESGSFASAKERIGYLEELKVWAPAFVPRIEAAIKSNTQVAGSWGVLDRVRAFAKKWARV